MEIIFPLSFQCVAFIMIFLVKQQTMECGSLKECPFLNLNKELHLVIAEIFELFQIKGNTTPTSPTIKLLLAMSENLNSVVEYEIKTYKNISNISQTYINNTLDQISEASEIIDELLNNTHDENDSKIICPENKTHENNYTSAESLVFIKDYLHKTENLKVEDILGSYNKSYESDIIRTINKLLNKEKRYNLKKWKPPNSSEEVNPNNTRRLYKGLKTSISKYPFMASVHVNGAFVCGGCIVSKDLVLTAAACLQIARHNDAFANRPSLFIRVASDYTNKLGAVLPITHVHFHPEFDPLHLRNNIVFAQVDGLKRLKRKKIQRIILERRQKWRATEGIVVKMLGWGDKGPESIIQGEPLSLTQLKIYDWHECQDRYTKFFVTKKNYCGGFTEKGGGACNRDIGGPAIVHGALVGLVSFGPPVCGTADAPTVFSDITQQLTWIDAVLRKVHT